MVTDLLLTLTPNPVTELRDRGLLAYHMNDFPAALRISRRFRSDRRPSSGEVDTDQRAEDEKVWEHVKALRRRVARAQLTDQSARRRQSARTGRANRAVRSNGNAGLSGG